MSRTFFSLTNDATVPKTADVKPRFPLSVAAAFLIGLALLVLARITCVAQQFHHCEPWPQCANSAAPPSGASGPYTGQFAPTLNSLYQLELQLQQQAAPQPVQPAPQPVLPPVQPLDPEPQIQQRPEVQEPQAEQKWDEEAQAQGERVKKDWEAEQPGQEEPSRQQQIQQQNQQALQLARRALSSSGGFLPEIGQRTPGLLATSTATDNPSAFLPENPSIDTNDRIRPGSTQQSAPISSSLPSSEASGQVLDLAGQPVQFNEQGFNQLMEKMQGGPNRGGNPSSLPNNPGSMLPPPEPIPDYKLPNLSPGFLPERPLESNSASGGTD